MVLCFFIFIPLMGFRLKEQHLILRHVSLRATWWFLKLQLGHDINSLLFTMHRLNKSSDLGLLHCRQILYRLSLPLIARTTNNWPHISFLIVCNRLCVCVCVKIHTLKKKKIWKHINWSVSFYLYFVIFILKLLCN